MNLYIRIAAWFTSLQASASRPRDERGLSQSTENAVLLTGAVSIALIVVTAITAYVKGNLPS